MTAPLPSAATLRFGDFTLDLQTGRLDGPAGRTSLPDQPLKILLALLDRPGDMVTRDRLQQQLWPDNTFVDFEHGLNAAVKRLRDALGDSADAPRFIETVPRRGYRFIAPVEALPLHEHPLVRVTPPRNTPTVPPSRSESLAGGPSVPSSSQPTRSRRVAWHAAAGLLLLLLGALAIIELVQSRMRGVASTRAPRSLAVLPLKPLTAAESDERLQMGMTEALIHQLSRIASLRVEPLARVRRFAAREQDPLEAGLALGVDAVLDGHYQVAEGRLSVRSRLLRTSDGTALAVDDWNQPTGSILDLQVRAAQSIAAALELTLTTAERDRIRKPDTLNGEAFRHYLFGRHHMESRSYEQMLEAERELRAALDLDPQYARAHAALAKALISMAWLDGRHGVDVMGPAKAAALQAIALDDSVALAHSALANVYEFFEADPVRAQHAHLRAMALDDGEPWVVRSFSSFLTSRDAFDEALGLCERYLALDPTSPFANRHKAQTLFFARRYDACVAQSRRTLPLDPHNVVMSYAWFARCLEQQGNLRESVDIWEEGRARRGDAELAAKMKGVFVARGWEGYWNEQLRMRAAVGASRPEVAVRLGRFEEAIEALERKVELRDPDVSFTNSPEFDPIRSDPRFQALRNRAGFNDAMNTALRVERDRQRAGARRE